MAEALVLIADDDGGVRRLIETSLRRLPLRFVHVDGGEAALAMARSSRPALALLDVKMPRPEGIEVCQQLKADPQCAGTKVVILTAFNDQDVRDAAIGAGADAFLTKPFRPSRLLALVQELLGVVTPPTGGDGQAGGA